MAKKVLVVDDEETILKVEDYIDGKLEIPMAVRDQIGCTWK